MARMRDMAGRDGSGGARRPTEHSSSRSVPAIARSTKRPDLSKGGSAQVCVSRHARIMSRRTMNRHEVAEMHVRPRRSVLYMPGANERALDKAKTIPADALILDLEDAVAPDAKPAARDRVCEAVTSGGYGGREVTIRVNGLNTEWGADDLRAAAKAGPAAVVVPKIDSAADIAEVERRLEQGGAPDTTRIWAMVETPAGLLAARDIATASERLTVLVMGTND